MDDYKDVETKVNQNEIAVRMSLLEKVICVKGTIGEGTKENPIRMCSLYYTTNGDFIGKITS